VTRFARLADGGRVAWGARGPRGAPAILLVRPFGGPRSAWGEFGDALAERLQVVAFDARGVGESSAVPWTASTRGMARDALAVLDAAEIARASVYGISLGGMIATWLAIDAAPRVDKLVLASTPARVTLSGVTLARALPLARWLAAHATRSSTPRRALAILLFAALRHDASSHLGRIAADTLALAGDDDALVNVASQRRVVELVPRARLVVARGIGHDLSAEAPAWTAERVIDHVLG